MKPFFKSIIILGLAAISALPLHAQENAAPAKDIVETAAAAGTFKTLTAALEAAGMLDTLKGEGSFTVFAPNDEAFAKLPAGTVESLLKPENKAKLARMLSYHVVAGEIPMAKALETGKFDTLGSTTINVSFRDGQVKIREAALVTADVKTTNGVIHVIDTMLNSKLASPRAKFYSDLTVDELIELHKKAEKQPGLLPSSVR